MTGSDEDHGRSRRPSAVDQGWSGIDRVLGSWMIERSGDAVWSAPCTWKRGARVSLLSLKTTGMICQRFGLKTTGTFASGLAS
jgi:hypothetical protein